MSFTLKDAVDFGTQCTSILVYDTTGEYSATPPQNLTGWNGIDLDSPQLTDVQTAVLKITTKDSAVPYEIDVFGTLPNIDDAPFTVTPAMIGYSGTIPDQVMKIEYIVTGLLESGTPFTYNSSCYHLAGCQIACCLKGMIAEAAKKAYCDCDDPCSCKCKANKKVFKAVQAQILYSGLQEQVQNRQYYMALATLSTLQNLCNCN